MMDARMTDLAPTRTTVSLTLNGRTVEAQKGELIITAAENAGTYIPRFCYHPRMEPVAFCRMCLVEVEGPRGATLQPSCFVAVAEGMVVNTESEKVKKAQDGVLEFLLANHPLDCPVCDKGGECPLQDQTLAHGSGETRFVEEKRHFAKPIGIGELVLLDRERCIQCARCTRFAAEVAGDPQIDFAGRGDEIEVAPFPTEPFDSVFSGNTVQICPVGALTAKPYRFSARPWDLEQVESTCTTCAVGCREAVQSAGGRLSRVLGIDSDPVNHGWLCDKGRFTIEAVQSEIATGDILDAATRITEPMVRRGDAFESVGWGEALAEAASILKMAREQSPNNVGAIGGAALTNEGAFAWERFLRGVVGTENIDAQYGDGLDPVLLQALPKATIDEAAAACTVVVLSGDLREELPILFLRLRKGAVKGSTSIVEFATGTSAIRGLSKVALATRPGEAHLVARVLAGDDAALTKLNTHPQGAGFSTAEVELAKQLIGETGEGVVFVVGRPNLAESSAVVESAIRTFSTRFPQAKFLPALRRSNVFGALDMGLAPGLRPGRTTGTSGRSAIEQMKAIVSGEQTALLLLGGCLLGNVGDRTLATQALTQARVIAVTGHGGASLAYADVILPAHVQHERFGTVTNIEGRVSAVAAKLVAPGSAWSDVAIASELAAEMGENLELDSLEAASAAIETSTGYPSTSVLRQAPSDGLLAGRENGIASRTLLDPMANPGVRSADEVGLSPWAGDVSLPAASEGIQLASARLSDVMGVPAPELPQPDAYSVLLNVTRRLYDRGIAMQGSPALHALISTTRVLAHPYDLDRLGLKTGDVARLSSERGSFELTVESNDAVPRGSVELAFGTLSDTGENVVGALISHSALVSEVRLESR